MQRSVVFDEFEFAELAAAVLIAGRAANRLKGLWLMAVYLILAVRLFII
jgi:hypothetical protein